MAQFYAARLGFVVFTVLVVSLIVLKEHALATSAVATPVKPDPALCTVAPRPEADFAMVLTVTPEPSVNVVGTPMATPTPPADGVPADEALQETITETAIAYVACLNASDLARFSSFLTDDLFRQFFAGTTAEHLAVLENTPPIPEDKRATIEAVSDIRVLADGRVTARLYSQGAFTLILFERVGNRWLIDSFYNVREDGTPIP